MSGEGGDAAGVPASLQNYKSASLPKKVGPKDFERLKLIGQGDVGKVYLVRLKGSNHTFAMKVLSKQEMIARNKLKRCLTEREILATVDYPFIVTLYYGFQSPDHLFLVMDYCAGGEFFRMLKSQPERRIPEEWVRFYASEVLLALEYLHTCGFIYRDLKPENILLHDTGHIMLTDFDLSKQAAVTAPVVKQSFFSNLLGGRATGGAGHIVIDTNSFVGTEEYIAPEVIKGSGQSSAVDWWTFGILVYEMAYGFTPFKGDTQHATFSNICGSDRIDIPAKPDLSNGFKKMIKGLLARDPGKRLGSKAGAAELKKCDFLSEVNWKAIRHQNPPYIPPVVDPLEAKSSGLREQQDERLDACLSWAPEILERMGSRSKTGSVVSSKAAAVPEKQASVVSSTNSAGGGGEGGGGGGTEGSPKNADKPEAAAKPAAPTAASSSSPGHEGGDLSTNDAIEPSQQPAMMSTLEKVGSDVSSSLVEESEEEAKAEEEAKEA